MKLPEIIQGGMGVGVSNWQLASAVSKRGQLGVVSGTALEHVLASRLMDGDFSGMMREALGAFPLQEPVAKILKRYFNPSGRKPGEPYKAIPNFSVRPPAFLQQLTAIANFVEVYLAKLGHEGVVGINRLEKIQMPTPASLYGALLAGVDYVIMGAGIPTQVAGMLDKLARHEPVKYRLDVVGADRDEEVAIEFDPRKIFPGLAEMVGTLRRPKFLPIISSAVLGTALIRKSEGSVDGFIIETPIAGGHNAPPRGRMQLTEAGEPIYGEKDVVNLEQVAALERPFWLAGGYGRPGGLKLAQEQGAVGIQVGTAFSLCEESGIEAGLNETILAEVVGGNGHVHTSPMMSPTGFPFKVAQIPGSVSDPAVYAARERVCDVGLLRTLVKNESGEIEYRCASEPVLDFLRKGGAEEQTEGRTCLCNNLLSTIGISKPRKGGYVEPPVITSGDDLHLAPMFIKPGQKTYTAADVLDVLLG
ncbi:nitronate monooxygenase [bacterium]|nr:nitronate monooxygenase [bacterium]